VTQDGGGIYNTGTMTITNSTISGNGADGTGGGIVASFGTLTLNNVTIANNTADKNADSFGDGGGIRNNSSLAYMKNILVAGNVDTGGQAPDCSGTMTSLGHNLIQSTTGCTITLTTGDITNAAPLLGSLQANGGPTLTHALLSGSPAIDAGDSATCATADQRGGVRPVDGNGDGNAICDIGAYEFGAMIPSAWLYLPLVTRGP